MKFLAVPVSAVIFAGCMSVCVTKPNQEQQVSTVLDASPDVSVTSVTVDASVTTSSEPTKCPSDMTLVVGQYCPNLEEVCLKWGDPDNKGANGPVQCLEFKFPTKCLSPKRVSMQYCIDTYPLPGKGEKPTTLMTWYDVKKVCESQGKRLCTRPEFTQACRGNSDKPYPYGDGYHRDCNACNCDKEPWLDPSTHKFEELDKRVPNGSLPLCVSDYGVHDMVGNNDRWVVNETGHPYQSALMGGHAVKGARNRCTPSTLVHNEGFSFYETGGLCCKDAK